MLCIVKFCILGLQAIAELTSIDEPDMPFVGNNDTLLVRLDKREKLIREMK